MRQFANFSVVLFVAIVIFFISKPRLKPSFSKENPVNFFQLSSSALHWLVEKEGTVFVANSHEDKRIAELGEKLEPGDLIETGQFGQACLASEEGNNIRLKENSRAKIIAPNCWEVECGLVGYNIKPAEKSGYQVCTPNVNVRVNGGIFVVKVNSILSRIALLKGKLEVSSPRRELRYLSSKQEVSASDSEISEIYEASDELYFAWYWETKPTTPSLASRSFQLQDGK